jgi:hypothetical protein
LAEECLDYIQCSVCENTSKSTALPKQSSFPVSYILKRNHTKPSNLRNSQSKNASAL